MEECQSGSFLKRPSGSYGIREVGMQDGRGERVWGSIDTLLRERFPASSQGMRGPASGSALERIEAETGLPLPQLLKEMLRLRDGQMTPSIFGEDFDFLAAKEILEHWRAHVSVLGYVPDESEVDVDPELVSRCDPGVKPRVANRKWLPFADSNGDVTVYVDFDPKIGGQIGQIIEVDPEGMSWRVLAASFDEYLANRLHAD